MPLLHPRKFFQIRNRSSLPRLLLSHRGTMTPKQPLPPTATHSHPNRYSTKGKGKGKGKLSISPTLSQTTLLLLALTFIATACRNGSTLQSINLLGEAPYSAHVRPRRPRVTIATAASPGRCEIPSRNLISLMTEKCLHFALPGRWQVR